jgi:hypothetical protein
VPESISQQFAGDSVSPILNDRIQIFPLAFDCHTEDHGISIRTLGVRQILTRCRQQLTDGLDRFRDYAVPTISARQGLPNDFASVLAAKDGSVWVGGAGGLTRLNNGQIESYRKRSAQAVGAGPELESITQDNRIGDANHMRIRGS